MLAPRRLGEKLAWSLAFSLTAEAVSDEDAASSNASANMKTGDRRTRCLYRDLGQTDILPVRCTVTASVERLIVPLKPSPEPRAWR